MALTRTFIAGLVWACVASPVSAQTAPADTAPPVSGEVSITGGVSTDKLIAAATQGRVFGESAGVKFFVEGAWTRTRSAAGAGESEAFSTAYPYEGPARLMEAYGEKFVKGDRFLGSVRAGRFRTPFGIYGASDHAYSGFLRAPLVRYEGYWALSNTFFEQGVNAMIGTSAVQVEVTAGRPADASEDVERRHGTDTVVRVQAYRGAFVVGLSHVRSETYGPASFASGRMVFSGVDVRWMSGGVQLRGEWLAGQPWDAARTSGGYLDAFVHRPFMGPVTLVTRVEALRYTATPAIYSSTTTGVAGGARIKIGPGLYTQLNVTHRPGEPYGAALTATDVALTYTIRYPR